MGVFIVMMVVVVGVVTAALFSSGGTSSHPGWNAAAQRLGLHYQHTDTMNGPTITGERRGFRVRVETYSQSGDDHRKYTRYRVNFGKSLGLGLRLIRHGPLAYISRKLGAQDIVTGDQDFDDAVIVKGRHPERVVEFLTPARRRAAVRFLSLHQSGIIDDSGIECDDRDVTGSPDRIVQVVQRLTALGEQFSTGSEDSPDKLPTFIAPDDVDADDQSTIFSHPAKVEPVFFPTWPETGIDSAEDAGTPQSFVDAPDTRRDELSTEIEPQDIDVDVHIAKENATTQSASMEDVGSDVETLARALFLECTTSPNTNDVFEAVYKGKEVKWSGTLTNVRSYRFDLVFGNEPGTRTEFEILKSADLAFLGRTVKAVVQFPAGSEDKLRAMVDRTLVFSGVLIGCDGFMKTLFLANGQITEVST